MIKLYLEINLSLKKLLLTYVCVVCDAPRDTLR